MNRPPQTEREFALTVVRRLREAGHEALWAGGCVRDELLGTPPTDYDVATSARPEQVRHLFRRTIAVGQSFGVVEVLGERIASQPPLKIQVATFRIDVYADDGSDDGRHPSEVRFCDAREDALRRDFTINGMFFDPVAEQLIDFVGGQDDLRERVLRAIGEPRERFTEDKLRLLRAVRFAARFELALDPTTRDAIQQMAGQVSVCSAERIAEELRKMLTDRHRARAMRLFFELGLAEPVLPALLPHHEQSGFFEVLARLPEKPSVPLALAALLRAVPLPEIEQIALRLRLSNEEYERIAWLVGHRERLAEAQRMPTSSLKLLLGHRDIDDLLALHRAEAETHGIPLTGADHAQERLAAWTDADLHPKLLLNGHDLMRAGLQPGPQFKRLLDALLIAQLEGTVTTAPEAWALIDRLKDESAAK